MIDHASTSRAAAIMSAYRGRWDSPTPEDLQQAPRGAHRPSHHHPKRSRSMSTLKLFQSAEWSVRVIDINGEPWFVARDVASVLGYSATSAALRILNDPEKGVQRLHTLGGEQNLSIVSESGLYRLITRSTRPEANAFQNWVFGEVLPQIRRTGSYAPTPQFEIPATYADALRLAADQSEQIERQKAEIAIPTLTERLDELAEVLLRALALVDDLAREVSPCSQ